MVRDNGNSQWMKACVVDHLREGSLLHAVGLIPDPAAIPLTVLDMEGKLREVTVPTSDEDLAADAWIRLEDTLESPAPLSLRNRDLPFWFTHLPGEGTVYFQFNQVRDTPDETMGAVGDRLASLVEQAGATRFVLDMRWNGGGNTLNEWALLRRLIANPADQSQGGVLRHHRAPHLLGRPERGELPERPLGGDLRGRTDRLQPVIHRRDELLRAAVQQDHHEHLRPALGRHLAGRRADLAAAHALRAAHLRRLPREP